MSVTGFDFRKPPPGELERQVAGWLTDASRRAAVVWGRSLAYLATLSAGPVETVAAGAALRALPPGLVGFPLTTPDTTCLLALPRPVLLALLAGLLQESLSELPEDRELTGVEAALCGFLVRELFLDPLEKAWPQGEPFSLNAGEGGSPHQVWRRPREELVLVAQLTVTAPFGEYPVHLLLPRSEQLERLAGRELIQPPVEPENQEQIERLVREMDVELSVVLGSVELTMLDVARLQPGDVVVLRQKVTEPLDALVSGARKFRVWPGAVGTRTAILIHTADV